MHSPDSRAKAPTAKRWEKGYGDENGIRREHDTFDRHWDERSIYLFCSFIVSRVYDLFFSFLWANNN